MHSAPIGVRKSTGHEVSAGAKRNRAGSDSFSLTGDSEERLFLAIGRAHATAVVRRYLTSGKVRFCR